MNWLGRDIARTEKQKEGKAERRDTNLPLENLLHGAHAGDTIRQKKKKLTRAMSMHLQVIKLLMCFGYSDHGQKRKHKCEVVVLLLCFTGI